MLTVYANVKMIGGIVILAIIIMISIVLVNVVNLLLPLLFLATLVLIINSPNWSASRKAERVGFSS